MDDKTEQAGAARDTRTNHCPDYDGGGIANLMASIVQGRGGAPTALPPLEQLPPPVLADTETLMLLVVDGLGYDYLADRPVSVLGKYLEGRMTSVFPSTTATAITTFLTAQAPRQHGLMGWFTFFTDLDEVVAVLPFETRRGGRSLAAEGVDAGAFFAHTPVFDLIDTPAFIVVPGHISHSPFNLAHTGRAKICPYRSLEEFFDLLLGLARAHGPKYVYAYWPDFDHLGHERGIGSGKARRLLHGFDLQFGGFVEALDGTDSLVIVTGDHGLIDAVPAREIDLGEHKELSRMLARPLCGERRAAYCYVRSGTASRFEHYVADALGDRVQLLESRQLLQSGWFGPGPSHADLDSRIGDYTLIPRGNLTIKDWVDGEKRHKHIGTHGGVSSEEMYVPLITVRT